jgi:hypothetical protein
MSASGFGTWHAIRIACCRVCDRRRMLDDGDICAACDTARERDITRLMESWGHDLDLLARFDAFCVARDRAA